MYFMNIEFQNKLIKLDYLTHTLKNNPHIKNSKTLFEQIISEAGLALQNLPAFKAFDPYTISWRNDMIHVLNDLSIELQKHSSDDKIQSLKKDILAIQSQLESIPEIDTKNKEIIKPKIDVKMAFLSDIDAEDYNGAIASSLKLCLNQGVPFITTRSLFRRSKQTDDTNRMARILEDEKSLLENAGKWDIFQNGEFLVFLPSQGLSPEETLRSFDLTTDGSLKKITAEETLRSPEKPVNFQTFLNLFVKNPLKNKMIYLYGHGSAKGKVGGLSKEHYLEFLQFLERQNCKGLIINSCYSGGATSLLSLPKIPSEEDLRFEENDDLNTRTFPIIVKSIGDFVTLGYQKAEENLKLLLDEVAVYLESHQAESISELRKVIDKVENKLEKSNLNLMKVYFPQSPGITGGFRPIGESGRGYSLTFTKAKQAEATGSNIQIKEASSLHIHPQVIQAPIVTEKEQLLLHSLIPGCGRHAMKSVKAAIDKPEVFIKNTVLSQMPVIGITKGFFIGTLESKGDSLKEVVIYISPTSTTAVYRKGDSYYYTNGKTTFALTALQHALFVKEVEACTRPSKEALLAASAGHENEASFQEALQGPLFYSDISPSKQWLGQLEDALKNNDKNAIRKIFHTNALTWLDKAHLILLLEETNHCDLALEFFKAIDMNPNIHNFSGLHLIDAAVANRDYPLIEYLIQKKVNVNTKNSLDDEKSPLHYAVESGDKALFDLLLQSEDIDVSVIDKNERSPLSLAIPLNPKFFSRMLKAKGNKSQKEPFISCLQLCLKDETKLNFLLTHGSSVLSEGISFILVEEREEELIRKLHTHGCFSFGNNEATSCALLYEAAARGSYPIFKFLLDNFPYDLGQINKKDQYKCILIAALLSGDEEKVKALNDRNISFPPTIKWNDQKILDVVFSRYEALNNTQAIESLLIENKGAPGLEHYVLDQYLRSKPEWILKWLSNGCLNPNTLICNSSNNYTIFSTICEYAPYTHSQKLVQTCLDKGAHIVHNSLAYKLITSPLCDWDAIKKIIFISPEPHRQAVKNAFLQVCADQVSRSNYEVMFKALVEMGADLNEINQTSHESSFTKVVKSGCQDLVKYCLDKGAKIHSSGAMENETPLQAAANLDHDPQRTIFRQLIEAGADINYCPSKNSLMPLESIVKSGNLDLINWCLDHKADIKLCSVNLLRTAATLKDNYIIFKRLVEAGAPINNYTPLGPVYYFIAKENVDMLDWCLAHGFTWNNKPDLIIQALTSKHLDIPKRILDELAKYPVLPGELLISAYTLSPSPNNFSNLEALFNLKKEFTPLNNNDKKTLWGRIINFNDIKSARLLLDHHIEPFDDKKEPIAQDAAIEHDRRELLQLLVKYNLFRNYRQINGASWYEIKDKDNVELLKFLQKQGVKFDDFSITTDFFFGEKPRLKLLSFLLEQGVSAHKEKTSFPLMDAVLFENIEAIKILLEKGGVKAETTVKSSGGLSSPLDYALAVDNLDIINLLTKI